MNPSMNISDPDFELTAALPLPLNEVQLWRVDMEPVADAEGHWRPLLSVDEQSRASRFHFSRDRQYFTAARAILRTLLAGYLGCGPKEIAFRYSAKDKPGLASPLCESRLEFNLSHSGTVALLAFTLGREIGVDVEQIRHDFEAEMIARRFFSPHEQQQLAALDNNDRYEAFFRCWTRKEAYVKATGTGLSLPLHQFDVSLVPGCSQALVATRPDAAEAARWSLREVPAGPGHVAAICVEGQGWNLKDWSQSQGGEV